MIGHGAAASVRLTSSMPVTLDIPAAEAAIVAKTNAFRAEHGRQRVRVNAQLAAAARAYAKKLAARQKLSHSIDGTTPSQRARKAGYSYCQIAENLATIYDSRGFTEREYAGRVVTGWEGSPGHRKNMLMEHVTEIGVAVARAPVNDPSYVAVQLFGLPKSAQYSFKISNKTKLSVPYRFGDRDEVIEPRYIITIGACTPGQIAFRTTSTGDATARYEARDGHLYTLQPAPNGGVSVRVSP